MRIGRLLTVITAAAGLVWLGSCAQKTGVPHIAWNEGGAQVPTWTWDDYQFFEHGSMSSEFVPETVLRAFIKTYPDLYPTEDLSHLGVIADSGFGWPVGFSRRKVAHLGGMTSVGINCAVCHVAEVHFPSNVLIGAFSVPGVNDPDAPGDWCVPVRVLGVTSHVNIEAFFGSVIVATFRTQDPANMKRFLGNYLNQCAPENDAAKRAARDAKFAAAWDRQSAAISAAMAADPAGAKGAGPGGLQDVAPASLRLDGKALDDGADLAAVSTSMLKLFHNVRECVHVPDQPPAQLPPPSGPGRNDAFGILSASLLDSPQPYAPVKFGVAWNVAHRHWVHWDGNTQSPIGRNFLAAVGLGAPLVGHEAQVNFALIQRQTDITENIAAPRYPFAMSVDRPATDRGAVLYQANCASCHDGDEGDHRLYALAEVGTEPLRAQLITPGQAAKFNKLLAELEAPGYVPPKEPAVRSTQKYWAANLAGIWARSPYLHNGSVRTMQELLTAPPARATMFHRGTRVYDPAAMGYIDAGTYVFDAKVPGNSNAGHDYGTNLTADQKRDLIEFLKTF